MGHCHDEHCNCHSGHCHDENCHCHDASDVGGSSRQEEYSTPIINGSVDIESIVAMAQKGIAAAQYDLGVCYNYGLGIDENPALAAQWFFKAAQQADGDAQFALGRLYLEGRGVPQTDDAARKWFEVAAQHGHPAAQNQMGYFYLNGTGGVKKNPVLAMQWWLEAAQNGFPEAMFNLALWYAKGESFEPDDTSALEWMQKAADVGFKPAIDFLNKLGVARQ